MRSLLLAGLSLFISASTVAAAPLTGRVVDSAGAAVPGATVLLTDGATIVRSTTTDAAGRFAIDAPAPGDGRRYLLRIALEGFRAEPRPVLPSAEAGDLGDIRVEVSALAESIVVSAAHVDVPLTTASSSVTVVTGAEIEARQYATVADVLRTVPGLALAANGGLGSLTSVFPRGGESDYSLVLVDDVQANAFGGGMDFAHLPAASIERVEIVRGPQSALYGSNAIGSVVRIVTRRGGAPVAGASIEGGSGGTMRATVGTAGSREAWEWGGSFEAIDSNGRTGQRTAAGETVVNDDYQRYSTSGSAGWRRGGANVRGGLHFTRNERGAPGPFGTNPAGFFGGIDPISRGEDDRWMAAVSGALPIGDRTRAQGQVTHARIDGIFVSPFGTSESSSRRTTVRGQADTPLRPGLDLSAGLELLRERAGSTFITAGADRVPVDRRVLGAFVETRWQANGRAFVTAGVRADSIRRDALAAHPGGFPPRPAFDAESVQSINPKVSAAWFLRDGAGTFTKLRASAGTGIRPPDGFEIAFTDNPGLKPERSRSVDAGIEQAFAGGRGLVEATWFANRYDDLIIAAGSFSQASRYRTDNIANARSRGLELAGTVRARIEAGRAVDLHIRTGYTLLDTQVMEVDGAGAAPPPFSIGDPLLRRPRHQFSVDALASSGRLTTFVRGGARSRTLDVEPTMGTFGGVFHAPGYHVWDTGAAWRFARQLEVFGRILNLFDRQYEEMLGFPAPGRAGIVGLRVAVGR